MFNPNIVFYGSSYETEDIIRLEFISKYPNTICVSEKYIINESLYGMTLKIKKYLEDMKIENLIFDGIDATTIHLQGNGIQILFTKSGGRMNVSHQGIADLIITGYPVIIEPLLNTLDNEYKLHQQGQLELWYTSKNGPTFMHVLLSPYGIYHPEFYPWLPTDFMDEYMASTASILFLTGEPGTGKTSI